MGSASLRLDFDSAHVHEDALDNSPIPVLSVEGCSAGTKGKMSTGEQLRMGVLQNSPGKCSADVQKCLLECFGKILGGECPMQDYQTLHAAVMIKAVNFLRPKSEKLSVNRG